MNYSITLEANNWNAVGVSSTADFNITHNSIPSTTSQLTGALCDFVVGDGTNNTLTANAGIVVEPAANGRPATLVHAKGTEFSGWFGVGLGVRLPLGRKIPEWLALSVTAGFITVDEADWEGSSTLILAHLDAGSDLLKSGPLRGGEFFRGEDKIGAGTVDSQTNYNGLAGAGLFIGLEPSPEFHIDLVVRLTFPLGSRNVRGITLVGLEAAFVF